MNKTYKKYYIAVDFDGTLCESAFPEIGAPRLDVMERLRNRKMELENQCYEVIFVLWTCRSNLPDRKLINEAIDWWKDNNFDKDYFPFTYINENPETDFGHPELVKKIFCNEYWDDRAVEV